MNERDVDVLRRELIGQIEIVKERLETLKVGLIDRPVGYSYVDNTFMDAQGNASLQMGMLLGILTMYREKLT